MQDYLVRQFPVLHFPVLHFQRPRCRQQQCAVRDSEHFSVRDISAVRDVTAKSSSIDCSNRRVIGPVVAMAADDTWRASLEQCRQRLVQ